MVHKPKHKVHSFRGLLGDGGQDEINLERSNVNLAYRVVKFEVIGSEPGVAYYEATVTITKESVLPTLSTIDFSDPDILAAAFYAGNAAAFNYPTSSVIIFDNMLFSRNIFVGSQDLQSNSMNYYIELEEVPVGAATLMQLKLGVARKLSLSESAPDA